MGEKRNYSCPCIALQMVKRQLYVMFSEPWSHKLGYFSATVILLLVVSFLIIQKNAAIFSFQKFKKYSTDYRKKVTVFFHLYPPLISLLLRGIMLSSICCVYFQSSFCAFIYTYVHKHTNKKVKINDIENKEAIERLTETKAGSLEKLIK